MLQGSNRTEKSLKNGINAVRFVVRFENTCKYVPLYVGGEYDMAWRLMVLAV